LGLKVFEQVDSRASVDAFFAADETVGKDSEVLEGVSEDYNDAGCGLDIG